MRLEATQYAELDSIFDLHGAEFRELDRERTNFVSEKGESSDLKPSEEQHETEISAPMKRIESIDCINALQVEWCPITKR